MTGFCPKVACPFLSGTVFAKLLRRAIRESGRDAIRVGRVVPVGIAVAVGIARVSGRAGMDGPKPRVVPRCDTQPQTIIAVLRRVSK